LTPRTVTPRPAAAINTIASTRTGTGTRIPNTDPRRPGLEPDPPGLVADLEQDRTLAAEVEQTPTT